ncbi:MAG: hypothetical protein WKF40_01600 [Thermoleophilaceae bacterium]
MARSYGCVWGGGARCGLWRALDVAVAAAAGPSRPVRVDLAGFLLRRIKSGDQAAVVVQHE